VNVSSLPTVPVKTLLYNTIVLFRTQPCVLCLTISASMSIRILSESDGTQLY